MRKMTNPQEPRNETRPQWTSYEVTPELVGNLTLIIYKNKDGIRQDQSLTPNRTDRLISSMVKNGCSVQRVYRRVDIFEIQQKIFEEYPLSESMPISEFSNELLDQLILQEKIK